MFLPLPVVMVLGILSAHGMSNDVQSKLPSVLIDYAKKHGCRALEDKPYIWGLFEPAEKKESAVFWCKTKADEIDPQMATIIIYIKDEKKLKNFCPPLRLEQPIRKGTLKVIRLEKGKKSEFRFDKFYYDDNQEFGPKEGIAEGVIIKNETTPTAGNFMICHNKRWLAGYYD